MMSSLGFRARVDSLAVLLRRLLAMDTSDFNMIKEIGQFYSVYPAYETAQTGPSSGHQLEAF